MRTMLEANQNVGKSLDVKPPTTDEAFDANTIDDQIRKANDATSKGHFAGISVESLDDITLDQLKKIDDIDNTFFNYNGKNYSVIDIKNMISNEFSLKDSLKNSVSEIDDPILKARKLYMELNKKLHYSMDYIKGSSDLKNKILNNYTSFDNLNSSNKVVCKGWSELYAEILEACGFSENSVKVVNSGKHRWVEIDLQDGNIILADATEAINGSIDLAASKAGFGTSGFMLIDNRSGLYNGLRPSDLANNAKNIDFINYNNQVMLDIDKQLGYAGENGYYIDELTKAKKLFGNNIKNKIQETKLVQKLFGNNIKNKTQETKLVQKLLDMEIPENMDGYEAFAYYRKLSKNLLGDNYRDINLNTLYNKTENGVDPINYLSYTADDGSVIIQLYGDSIGKQRFSSFDEYNKYYDTLNIMKEGEIYG